MADFAPNDAVHFETPENVQVSYRSAGLGTRFLASFIDSIILGIAIFVIWMAVMCSGVAFDIVGSQLGPNQNSQEAQQRFIYYSFGIGLLLNGIGGFVYFTISELSMRGQTFGKRNQGLRVVKANGFSIDAGAIFVRNLFRIIDQFPPLWLVPFFSTRAQRLGDMAAGTIVIVDKPALASGVREEQASRSAANLQFRFDGATLARLRPADVQALEKLLSRWKKLPPDDRADLFERIVSPIAARLQVALPEFGQRLMFMDDLLTAELHRQHRKLG